jgi:hypothetical protein
MQMEISSLGMGSEIRNSYYAVWDFLSRDRELIFYYAIRDYFLSWDGE